LLGRPRLPVITPLRTETPIDMGGVSTGFPICGETSGRDDRTASGDQGSFGYLGGFLSCFSTHTSGLVTAYEKPNLNGGNNGENSGEDR
jgi:hypothetical protein